MSSHLENLNPQQLHAVTYRGGPVLVLAGAGSGKTRVITRRVASAILDDGLPPDRIMAVTFTNKAAEEMRERVRADTGAETGWIATFHSACVRILRAWGQPIGVGPDFTIYDGDDQKKVIKMVIEDCQIDTASWSPAFLLGEIRAAKTRGLDASSYADEASGWRDEGVAKAFAGYERQLRESNALDFDDLLLRAVDLLQQEEGIRAHLQERFVHLLVDEFQDTNVTQYQLLRLLVGPRRHVCVTGDPDQSIYSWRGADLRNILGFTSDFPDAELIRLEQNYRSTRTILHAADSVIAHNQDRLEKRLWTENPDGDLLELLHARDERDEALGIAQVMVELREAHDLAWRDLAVFFRTNAQSRPLEEVFAELGVPYLVIGTMPFYERAEVKDVLAYLRFLVNGRDRVALERAIATPRRGVGAKALETIRALAHRSHDGNYWSALQDDDLPGLLRGRARQGVAGFRKLLEDLHALDGRPCAEVTTALLEDLDYLELLRQRGEPEREEHVGELLSAMADHDRRDPEGGVVGFLETTALASEVDRWDPGVGAVALMTMHAAKGLEFPVVFVAGLEDGLCPLERAETRGDLAHEEEERRLFYVALTRAKERVYLSLADRRMRFGRREFSYPSRLLGELPVEVFRTTVQADDLGDEDAGTWGRGRGRGTREPLANEPGYRVDYEPGYGLDDDLDDVGHDDEAGFVVGDLVEHPRFGQGEVTGIRRGLAPRVVVDFRRVGERTVDLRYSELRRVTSF
jgi:DNA helicase-2/ATP-dependent DNA helicase PcrA